jgi:hypothetical protein
MKTSRFNFRLAFFLAVIVLAVSCQKEDPDEFDNLDILAKINSLEGVSAIEIAPQNQYYRSFQVDVTQPVDHTNPSGAKFTQRVYLNHIEESKPLVFAPNGYWSTPASSQEIAGILQTNCLTVTHRYFYDSRPNPLNWQYLTIKQAADDHHRIVTLFKKIYKGKWVSSGGSKSGLASLFHKRYYPDDVDATIAYVAPFTFGPKDDRYPEYLSNIGGADCYAKLVGIQQFVLKHRSEIIDIMNSYISSHSDTYTMDRELILELNIMDFPFVFWQIFNYECSTIPDTSAANPADIFNYFISIVPLNSYSDASNAFYEPYVYQAVTELGAPAYDFQSLSGLLKKVDPNSSGNPNYELVAPAGVEFNFNATTMPEIYNWLQNYGDRIIYIYGKNDPWSAGAIELNGSADAVFVMQDGANHRVRIANLDNPEIVYLALENWLNLEIGSIQKKQKNFKVYEDELRFRLAQ